ncbi:MAG: BrnA antitoxin family protein [Parcubacteria group bacterium]|nr:BrnA antitoxin family protein [Parcubacteria group bacterium]
MKKRFKKLPKFKNEAAERKFWQTHDSTEYIDWSKSIPVYFPNLKPSSQSISLRIPKYLIMRLKEKANALDIPYQTLMKQYIAKGVFQESAGKNGR